MLNDRIIISIGIEVNNGDELKELKSFVTQMIIKTFKTLDVEKIKLE